MKKVEGNYGTYHFKRSGKSIWDLQYKPYDAGDMFILNVEIRLSKKQAENMAQDRAKNGKEEYDYNRFHSE